MWPGLHLGHEIFITCLQERGQVCSSGESLLCPGCALKCARPGGLGHPHSAPEASEQRGLRKLKGRKNKQAHSGFAVLLGPTLLTGSSKRAFEAEILMPRDTLHPDASCCSSPPAQFQLSSFRMGPRVCSGALFLFFATQEGMILFKDQAPSSPYYIQFHLSS